MQPSELYMLWQPESQRFVVAIDELWNLKSEVLRVK